MQVIAGQIYPTRPPLSNPGPVREGGRRAGGRLWHADSAVFDAAGRSSGSAGRV